jgi:hypothetical protein
LGNGARSPITHGLAQRHRTAPELPIRAGPKLKSARMADADPSSMSAISSPIAVISAAMATVVRRRLLRPDGVPPDLSPSSVVGGAGGAGERGGIRLEATRGSI